MLKRLSTFVFHPRMIGVYLKDSFLKVISIVSFFFIITMIPYLFQMKEYIVLDESYTNQIINLVELNNLDLKMENSVLSGDKSIIELEELRICFFTENNVTDNKIVFEYYEDHYYVKYANIRVASSDYSKMHDFDIDQIDDSFNQKEAFRNLFSNVYESVSFYTIPYYLFVVLGTQLLIYVLIILMAFFVNRTANPILPKKIVLKVAIYSITVCLVLDLIQGLYGIYGLSYISYVLPMIYTRMSLKCIVKVKK